MNDQRSGGIGWTDWTANPIKYRNAAGDVVWSCEKISQGCTHCYAETLALRYGRGGPFNAGVQEKLTPFLDPKEVNALLTSKKIAGCRVFIGDMTDIFGDWVPDALLDELFHVFASRKDVTFQVLTKRAERMKHWFECGARVRVDDLQSLEAGYACAGPWPLPNVHLMVSAENQEAADLRVPFLLETPAAVRGVSYEPALGPVDFRALQYEGMTNIDALLGQHGVTPPLAGVTGRLDWIIVGGESGAGARRFEFQWARDVIRQAAGTGCAVFMKQMGSYLNLRHRKGADPAEWPAELRVQQFPTSRDGYSLPTPRGDEPAEPGTYCRWCDSELTDPCSGAKAKDCPNRLTELRELAEEEARRG